MTTTGEAQGGGDPEAQLHRERSSESSSTSVGMTGSSAMPQIEARSRTHLANLWVHRTRY